MDVILLKDVESLGATGVIVQVTPGYARNYLLPLGLAAPATPERLKMIEETKRQRSKKTARMRQEAEAVKRALEGRAVTLTLSVGEEDKPFGSITGHDIMEALVQGGIALEKHAVQLKQPIKTLGVFEVPVRLHPDVTATVKVSVVKE